MLITSFHSTTVKNYYKIARLESEHATSPEGSRLTGTVSVQGALSSELPLPPVGDVVLRDPGAQGCCSFTASLGLLLLPGPF